jgi:hypothetical protein
MNSVVLDTIIASAADVFGALIIAFFSNLTSRQKIREIKLDFAQRIHENYLTNARIHTDSIYIPLNIILSRHTQSYSDFRISQDPLTVNVPTEAMESFRKARNEFVNSSTFNLIVYKN